MGGNILVISYGFPPWGGAAMERALMLVRYLPKFGWNPVVLCASADSPHQYDDPEAMLLLPENTVIHRIPFPMPFRLMDKILLGKLLFRLLYGFPDIYRVWVKQCLRNIRLDQLGSVDAVLTTSPPHSIHIAGEHLSKKLGVPWVMDLRDAWVGNRMTRWYTPLHKFCSRHYYRKAIRNASLITTNTIDLEKKISTDFPEEAKKIISVPNGYDEKLFTGNKPSRPAGMAENTRMLLYSGGTYGDWGKKVLRDLCIAIEKIRVTNKLHNNVNLYIAGEMSPSESYEGVGPIGLGHVSLVHVPSLLLGADILVLCMPQEEKQSGRILLKAYGYARAQKPVLYLGPENATYDYLASRTVVQRFDLFQLQDAACWVMSIPDKKLNIQKTIPASVYECSFEERISILANTLNRMIN